jgi:plastocyanin
MRRSVVLAVLLTSAVGAPPAAADLEKVDAFNNYFTPKKVEIRDGDKVRWTNQEGTHTVTVKSDGPNLDEVISGTASVTRKFKKEGTYRYVCTFHEETDGMRGKIVVK